MKENFTIIYDCPNGMNDPRMDKKLTKILRKYGYIPKSIMEDDPDKRVLAFEKCE